MTDAERWSALLTFIGVIAGAMLTLVGGWIKARREGVTGVTIAEIGDRAKFRSDLMVRVAAAEKRADEAVSAVHRTQQELIDLADQKGGLEIENAALRLQVGEIDTLRRLVSEQRAEIEELRRRLEAHEKRCRPRRRK